MARKRRPGRPKVKASERRTVLFSLRLTEKEVRLIERAAGPFPPRLWARIALVEAAKKKGGNVR